MAQANKSTIKTRMEKEALRYMSRTLSVLGYSSNGLRTFYFYKCNKCHFEDGRSEVKRHILDQWMKKDPTHIAESIIRTINKKNMVQTRNHKISYSGSPRNRKSQTVNTNTQSDSCNETSQIDYSDFIHNQKLCWRCFKYNIEFGYRFYFCTNNPKFDICMDCYYSANYKDLEFKAKVFDGIPSTVPWNDAEVEQEIELGFDQKPSKRITAGKEPTNHANETKHLASKDAWVPSSPSSISFIGMERRKADSDGHEIDNFSLRLLKALNPNLSNHYIPIRTKGDGNCLFRAASIALFGTDTEHESLRYLVGEEMKRYQKWYDKDHPGFCSPLANDLHIPLKDYEFYVGKIDQLGTWSDINHLYALSAVIKAPIESYLPTFSGLTSPYSRLIVGRRVRKFTPEIKLMWTSSSVTPQNFEKISEYIDHFVPLLPLRNSATSDDDVSYEHQVYINICSNGSDEKGDNSSVNRDVTMLDNAQTIHNHDNEHGSDSSQPENRNDCLLSLEDIDSLRPNMWITDNVIWRFVNYLLNNLYIETGSPILDTIAIISPAICVQIRLAQSEMDIIEQITALDIAEKDYVVIFVSDATANATTNTPGSHWSVMIYFKQRNWFHHIDSIKNGNDWCAKILYKKFAFVLSLENCRFSTCDTNTQNNGFDCGLFTIMNTKVFFNHFFRQNRGMDEFCAKHNASKPTGLRQIIKDALCQCILHHPKDNQNCSHDESQKECLDNLDIHAPNFLVVGNIESPSDDSNADQDVIILD